MRVLVCGGRDYGDAESLHRFMDELARRITLDTVIEWDARGADRMAVQNLKFRAEWEKLGRKTGPIAISSCSMKAGRIWLWPSRRKGNCGHGAAGPCGWSRS